MAFGAQGTCCSALGQTSLKGKNSFLSLQSDSEMQETKKTDIMPVGRLWPSGPSHI